MGSESIEIELITAQIQKECHETVEGIMYSTENKNINVQDATNVFMYKKLAEFEYRLRQLERTKPNH